MNLCKIVLNLTLKTSALADKCIEREQKLNRVARPNSQNGGSKKQWVCGQMSVVMVAINHSKLFLKGR